MLLVVILEHLVPTRPEWQCTDRGEFSFTPSFSLNGSDASFLGNMTSESQYKAGLNQFGFVIPFGSRSGVDEGKSKVVFGIGYNKLKDFGAYTVMQGVNNQNSLVDEFVYTANLYDDWDPFSDELAWETFLIDYDTLSGQFYSDFNPPYLVNGASGPFYGQDQRRTVRTSGQIGEYVFNLGANLSHKLYVGASLGIQRAEYEELWIHTEEDPADVIDYFEAFSWRNSLYTKGRGMNFKLGFIARPVEYLRVGGAIHTPTFFKMRDDFTTFMETDLADGEPVHEFEAFGEFDYEIVTPFRAIGSLAVTLKNMAIISLDYEYVDYSSARLRGGDDFFDRNQAISNRFRATSNLRAGGEVHFGPMFFRAGYALYGSPYVEEEPNNIQVFQAISGGFGYRTSSYYFDLGVVRSGFDQKYYLYHQTNADISVSNMQFMATVGMRF